MTDTNQEREDEVLRRMLKTPPKPHKEKSRPVIAKREQDLTKGARNKG